MSGNVIDDVNNLTPIIDISLKNQPNKFVYAERTTTTAAVVFYTAPTNCDVWLHGIDASLLKDVTSDNVYVSISAQIGGAYRQLLVIQSLTLTAAAINKVTMFPYPIKLDIGGSIAASIVFTVGATKLATCLFITEMRRS
jgi:hypothetical protein